MRCAELLLTYPLALSLSDDENNIWKQYDYALVARQLKDTKQTFIHSSSSFAFALFYPLCYAVG